MPSITSSLFIVFSLLMLSVVMMMNVSSINAQTPLAHCLLRGTTNAKGLKGVVTFTQSNDGITSVNWSLDQSTVPIGLQGKLLGFHIHEYGYIADAGATGGHYNPHNKNHALPSEDTYPDIHIGDLGNIDLSKGYSGVVTTNLTQFNGSISIIGRAIRLHMSNDTGKIAQPTGDAGAPAAHCVIGIYNSNDNTMTYNNEYNGNVAVAVLQKTSAATTNVTGRVIFSFDNSNQRTRIYGKICGLPSLSTHGFHIHTYGELDLVDGTRTGGHFNPFGKNHGYPGDAERHVGDLGNVTSDNAGIANFDFTVDLIELTGVRNIIGRGLVLHSNRDDGNPTTPTGNAGGRIAVAALGIPSSGVSLTSPVDACVDPAPPADVVVNPTTSPIPSPKPSPKPSTKVNASTITSFSVALIVLISFIVSLL